MKLHWFGKTASEKIDHARKEEFASVFECERVGLQKLALLLTANADAAKLCLIRTFQEGIASSSVSKEWILSWTRRMVIRNAIRLVMGPRDESFVNMRNDADEGLITISKMTCLVQFQSLNRFSTFRCSIGLFSLFVSTNAIRCMTAHCC